MCCFILEVHPLLLDDEDPRLLPEGEDLPPPEEDYGLFRKNTSCSASRIMYMFLEDEAEEPALREEEEDEDEEDEEEEEEDEDK